MKYLRSTTGKAYQFNGYAIPNYKGEMLALTDDKYAKLVTNTVVKSLIGAGAIFVTDKAPVNPSKQAQQLTNQNAALILQNTKLQEENAKLLSQLKASGTDEASVKAAIAKQKEEDEAKVTQIVEAKDTEIAKLKAQLEAATSASKTAAAAAAKVAEE